MNLKESIRRILKEIGDSIDNTYECYVNFEDEQEGEYGFESDKYEYIIEISKPLLYYDFKRKLRTRGLEEIVETLQENNISEDEIKNIIVVAFDIVDKDGYTSGYTEITNDNFFKVMSTIYKTIMRYKKKYKTNVIYINPSDNRRKNVYLRFFKNYNIVDKIFSFPDGILITTK